MEETTGSCNAVAPFDSGEVVAVRAAESITKGNGETSLLSRTEKKKKPEASTHESVNNSSPRRDDGAGEDGGLERRWCFAAGREPPVVPPPRSILFLSRLRRRRPSLSLLCSALLCSSLSPLMRIEEAIQSSNCGGTRKAGAVGSEAFDTGG